jgi:succinate dehydrogenase / fumarate reductase membrane anchor subunit
MKKSYKESSKTGALAWFLQRISAVILFVLLMVHFVTYHFIAKGVIKYTDIVAKMKSPWFTLIQFLFLISALYHGLNGIWAIAEDYCHHRGLRLTILALILIVGSGLLFVGTLTIIKVGLKL